MVRPFLDLASYRSEVCNSTLVRIETNAGATDEFDKAKLLSTFPLPPLSNMIVRFLRWWWSRQLAALDELRLLSDVCAAVAQDLAATSIDPDDLEGASLDADSYYDARSNPDWFYQHQAQVGILRHQRRSCC